MRDVSIVDACMQASVIASMRMHAAHRRRCDAMRCIASSMRIDAMTLPSSRMRDGMHRNVAVVVDASFVRRAKVRSGLLACMLLCKRRVAAACAV